MAKYRVMCIRYGWAVVEADNECAAETIAEGLPVNAFDWSDTDDHQVVEEVNYE